MHLYVYVVKFAAGDDDGDGNGDGDDDRDGDGNRDGDGKRDGDGEVIVMASGSSVRIYFYGSITASLK